jgi:hypothetical protein
MLVFAESLLAYAVLRHEKQANPVSDDATRSAIYGGAVILEYLVMAIRC